MIGRLIILAFLVSTGPAFSQSVQVRSGEHDGFTRLVLYLPNGVEASVQKAVGSASITTNRPVSFQIDTVYDRIGRDRFAAVTQDDLSGSLELSYACDCRLRSEMLVGNVLVLDLVGDSATAGPAMTESTRDSPETTVDPVDLPPVMPQAPVRPSMQDVRAMTEAATSIFPTPPVEDTQGRLERLAKLESEMIQQVARTATQGLLDVTDSAVAPAPVVQTRTKDMPVADNLPAAKPQGGARMHTSDLSDQVEQRPVTANGGACIPSERLDIAAWAGTDGFSAGLGAKRSAIYGEFEKIEAQAVADLARYYLSYGFGAEARATLALLDMPVADGPILLSMARILDGGADPRPSPFDDQLDCDSAVALWAALATKPLPRDEAIRTSAILRSLNALPSHLRAVLGALLADRFLAAGDPETSQAVLRVIDRGGEGASPRKMLVEGKMAIDQGALAEGRETLEGAIGNADETAPEALIALVDDSLRRGMPVPPETAELLGAYVLQYRQSALATDLMRAEILARAGAGQFDAAFGLWATRRNDDRFAPAAAEIRNQIIDVLLTSGVDADVLRIGLGVIQEEAKNLSQANALDLAARFLDMGFPDLADQFVEAAPDRNATVSRLLRARVALSMGQPRRAEAELLGIASKEADALRAEAQSAAGDHVIAADAFDRLDRPARAAAEAWRGSKWEALSRSDDELKVALSTLMTSGGTPTPPDIGDLARNRLLLQDSVASRATLMDLLDRYQSPPSE